MFLVSKRVANLPFLKALLLKHFRVHQFSWRTTATLSWIWEYLFSDCFNYFLNSSLFLFLFSLTQNRSTWHGKAVNDSKVETTRTNYRHSGQESVSAFRSSPPGGNQRPQTNQWGLTGEQTARVLERKKIKTTHKIHTAASGPQVICGAETKNKQAKKLRLATIANERIEVLRDVKQTEEHRTSGTDTGRHHDETSPT